MVLAPWYHTGTNVSRKPTPPCEVGLSPVCCCGALPQPRSSRIAAALTRALSLSLASAMPPSVLMAIGAVSFFTSLVRLQHLHAFRQPLDQLMQLI